MPVSRKPTGDMEEDLDSLVLMLRRVNDAFSDFCAEPHVDEVSELSMWTRTLFDFGSHLETQYGALRCKQMFGAAWREVRQ